MARASALRPRSIFTALISALFILAIIAFIAGYVLWQHLQRAAKQPRSPGAEHYVIESGETLGDFLAELQSRQVVDDIRPLKWWSRINGNANLIKAGRYQFEPEQSFAQMLEVLINGDVTRDKIALIEGQTIKELLSALKNAKGLVTQVSDLPVVEIMARLGKSGMHPEGQFFPDTYLYDFGSSDIDILRRANSRLDEVLTEVWRQRHDDLPIKSPEEALILASIIEKETSVAAERPVIAGVFINRLRRGMRLQTDPTVIYGIGDAFDGNLTRKHLQTDTPYNTYTRAGLPPTPIAAVGREALEAAVNPAATKALYFVAKGDGSHQFSETLEQHNAAVKRYQLNKRS